MRDERFRLAAITAEANGLDVAVVLRERDEVVRAARIARALVIAELRRKTK